MPTVTRVPHNADMTESDRQLLEFEDAHPKHTGIKQETIRLQFGMSYPRYIQRLLTIMEDPDAVAAYPMVVHRIERQAGRARG